MYPIFLLRLRKASGVAFFGCHGRAHRLRREPEDSVSDYAESTTNQHGALVRRYYDLVDAKNIDGLLALFSDDAVYQRPGYPAFHGREAMRAFYTGQRIIEHGHHKLFTVISEDAQVSTRGEFRGQLKDGRSISVGFADFFTVGEGGLFTHRDTYFSMPAV